MTDIPIMFDHVSDSFCVKDGDKWLYFDSVLKAKDAVRQVKMKEAVKAEREQVAAWLRRIGKPQMADAIEAGEHLQ